jgi:putative Holliday junction resolvase
MRYLAIDLGAKRTGLAVGDDRTGIVSPLKVIATAAENERWRQVAQAIEDQGPDGLILGLPLNMDGSEGTPAKLARQTAAELGQRFGLPVHLVDERKSSEAANERMSRSGLTHGQKKDRRDALAAAEILRRFLADRQTDAPH